MDYEGVDRENAEDLLHLVDREILPEPPGDSDQFGDLELSPLLGRGLVLLVVHQHGDQPVHLLVEQLEHEDSQRENGVVYSVGLPEPRDLDLGLPLLEEQAFLLQVGSDKMTRFTLNISVGEPRYLTTPALSTYSESPLSRLILSFFTFRDPDLERERLEGKIL